MGLAAVEFAVEFQECTCSECGIVYFVPDNYQSKRRKDHKTFYCPNGHNQYYPQESEAEKYKRKAEVLADQVRMEREQREKAERKLRRVQKGTCPQCNRHFVNVERHMKSKHKGLK